MRNNSISHNDIICEIMIKEAFKSFFSTKNIVNNANNVVINLVFVASYESAKIAVIAVGRTLQEIDFKKSIKKSSLVLKENKELKTENKNVTQ